MFDRRWMGTWIAIAVIGSCGASLKKLAPEEVDAYHALSPFMDDAQEKAYLKCKTPEERVQFLKDQKMAMGASTADNLYDLWYDYDEATRDAITAGDVKVGWTQAMMFMAWGEAYNRMRLTGRNAERSELFVYRFETAEDGSVFVWVPKSKASYKSVGQFQLDVYMDDGRITDIVKKDAWE
jgi:hypothetical protein